MSKVKRVKRMVCVNDLFLVGNGQLNVCLELTKRMRTEEKIKRVNEESEESEESGVRQ